MTPTAPDRLDRIEAAVEQIVTKLDSIADDVTEIKITQARFEARTDERFNAMDQRFDSLEKQFNILENRVSAQDSRLWTFVSALILALVGLLAKLAFFPKL
ncbi:hypothetical protein GS597_00285 [Synechococcales cyanobacterium C]|uniref:Uncharacterized protein n=1 Tax=Petrachloros mirabilis ULC683 TaxID=2781853 RepID=A0A8K1ZW53_9CYAN|nr:hypothetical protein [Petrachloros mirabilis]NCJ04982.1 hypothetical protein [Petrachloros mirabilis ULC683]